MSGELLSPPISDPIAQEATHIPEIPVTNPLCPAVVEATPSAETPATTTSKTEGMFGVKPEDAGPIADRFQQ
ncbi:hypothetical protein A2773_06570 [Candidatus Gottesmanbacteria bacterium RIFCSPHIGHO2_01_FULL_39_10]|uniref:Uncharacterized protein n=1 Tax=Candidatus Gottesmanbacteria bacterium RIFCSPHIGHO2_01_FULL_39_10 TaxID=1798375 RepID=A0A1F5ZPE4_9BACT|nr:MAG: hypothetical protein A2773_06570 [Candidatus Gottesmanbacteria bacterium RIFCSPHIGHO2_01_FULL_39_10]